MELREIWKRLKGIILFGITYLVIFFFIEARKGPVHIIHTALDDLIPFCEYFIIPYVLWFFYVAGTVLYLALTDRDLREYKAFITTMMLGMAAFVVVSLIYPNGQSLRPQVLPDNLFSRAVGLLYTVDTPTNVLPSLHVFASVACDIALCRAPAFQTRPTWQWASHLLTVSIILSTMFLKQHSIIDVAAALLCNLSFYPLVYRTDSRSEKWIRKARKASEEIL